MTKLINEDWEHAAYANDIIFQTERNYQIQLEFQEWKYYEKLKNKKPAKIIIEKLSKDENTHNASSISRNNQEKL